MEYIVSSGAEIDEQLHDMSRQCNVKMRRRRYCFVIALSKCLQYKGTPSAKLIKAINALSWFETLVRSQANLKLRLPRWQLLNYQLHPEFLNKMWMKIRTWSFNQLIYQSRQENVTHGGSGRGGDRWDGALQLQYFERFCIFYFIAILRSNWILPLECGKNHLFYAYVVNTWWSGSASTKLQW